MHSSQISMNFISHAKSMLVSLCRKVQSVASINLLASLLKISQGIFPIHCIFLSSYA